MKANQMRIVIAAVRSNISLLKASKGEGTLIGLEGFTPQMLEIFDSLYDQEASKIMK